MLTIGTLLSALAVGLGTAHPRVAEAAGLECSSHVAVDYEAPLRKLPRLRQPKQTGSLPFTKAKIHGTRGEPSVQTGRGRIGFAFIAPRFPERGLRLGWRVSVAVARVDSRGRIARTLQRSREAVKVAHRSEQLDFTVPAHYPRGIYRYEIELADLSGTRLARYGQYIRVMKPTIKPTLSARESPTFDGAQLRLQIANLGTTAISYGKGGLDRVERFEEGEWRAVDILDRRGVRRSLRSIAAGIRGPCESVPIADNAPPGRYRVVMKVYPGLAKHARAVRAGLRLRSGTYG
jgi:hypothetical protein